MLVSSAAAPALRSLFGSICLLGCLLLVNACGTSESARQTRSTPTLHLTAYDSTTGEPLDSARAINRTGNDSLETDSAGSFVIRDVDPALYVFDVGGYGYHTQRHVAALVEPGDTTVRVDASLLPQLLSLNCEGSRPYNWDQLVSQYRDDSTRVRIQLIDVFARDGRVRVQPVLVNDLPTNTLFLPDNFGALGHYELRLFDGDNNPVPFTYENEPRDEGHRIYSKSDILPVVPQDAKRLEQSTLLVGDSVQDGTTLYAQMEYTFSADDTLQATSATSFPELNLDSLQVPVFDTLRTDGRVKTPDSLVIQRDTTTMRVVGIDTTVTRSGYVLFSTLRASNAAPTPEAARNLLYVPDSVKARARRDSLEAIAEADTTVPAIDTAAVPGNSPRFHVVDRTDDSRLDSLITDDRLSESLANGLPDWSVTADSLLQMSAPLRSAFMQTPTLERSKTRTGLDTGPDTLQSNTVIMSAPVSDSLFQMLEPDSLGAAPDTTLADSLVEETPKSPFLTAKPNDSLAPDVDSISIDSLRLTVPPESDSVVVDSSITDNLQNPPTHTYWHVPDSLSRWRTRVMVVDPAFFRLRAESRIDTSSSINTASLLPDRLGTREEISVEEYPQQVVRIPTGTYRSRYLQVWKQTQASRLKEHYCQIFPFPLRSEWRSTSMH